MKLTKKAYTVEALDYKCGEIRTQVVVAVSEKSAINTVKAQLGEYAYHYVYHITEVRTID